jgi:uncharacterized protein (UPF0276 family)
MSNTLTDRQLIEEAIDVLLAHMEPAKVAKFLSIWQTDGENYLDLRDRLFGDEKVHELVKRLREFEANH